MSNSGRSRWKFIEQKMTRIRINVTAIWWRLDCTRSPATWRRWHNDKKLWSGQSQTIEYPWQEAEGDRQQPTPTPKILEDWENKCILATTWHRGVQKDMLHQPQNTSSLRDTRNITMYMVAKVSLLSNFTPRMSRLGLEQMETPDNIKSPFGGFTVLDRLTTEKSSTFVRIHYHPQVIASLLSSRTGSALAWHTHGSMFKPRLVQSSNF